MIRDTAKRREYHKEWNKNQRIRAAAELNQYKIEKGCTDCGYNEHPAALEFDHLDPTLKKGCVASMLARPNLMWEEIKKCEVVCSNCHSIRTYNRKISP